VTALEVPRIRVRGGPDAPARVRRALERELGDLDSQVLFAINLLASEIITNSVMHAGVGADGWVSASVVRTSSHIRIEIRDSGPPGEPSLRTPDRTKGGGFGLFLVDEIAANWGADRSDDPCVWFELAIP
jgi:anti-sigma regulatory factor (Ser/Thr protein kinase)